MLIIDSLLKFNFFLSGEVQRTSLFLGTSNTSSNGIASHVDCGTQLRSVVRLIGAEHGKQSMQQLSHDRYDGKSRTLGTEEGFPGRRASSEAGNAFLQAGFKKGKAPTDDA